ncbi:MAG: tetratricopeptide repeat protein [Hydrogenophilales bacterium]|nr:tetratricopeptide repeat protein [Hydrogenophilales bacterium]
MNWILRLFRQTQPTADNRVEALEARPKQMLFEQAQLLINQKKWGEAAFIYKQLVDVYVEDADAWYGLGNFLYQMERADEAISALEKSVQLNANIADAHFKLGSLYQDQGLMPQARASYERVIVLSPENAQAVNNLGVILDMQGQVSEAIDRYRNAVSLDSKLIVAYLNLGNLFFRLGRYDEAAQIFNTVIAIEPRSTAAQLGLSAVLVQNNNFDQAKALLYKVVRDCPEYADGWIKLGEVLTQVGDTKGAVEIYQQALKSHPQHTGLLNNLGQVHAQVGALEQALECFLSASQSDQTCVSCIVNAGTIFQQLERYQEAEQYFLMALTKFPNEFQCHLAYANYLVARNQLNEAQRQVDIVLSLRPNSPKAQTCLASLRVAQGQPEQAALLYEAALAQGYKNAGVYTALGGLYTQSADFDRALECFDEALKFAPNMHEYRFNRAYLLLLLGRLGEGFAEYESRLNLPRFRKVVPRLYEKPLWDGIASLQGKRLLVHAEQGYGDMLQYARYLALVKPLCAGLLFEGPPEMKRIISSISEIDSYVVASDALTDYDFHFPLMSLAKVFWEKSESIPNRVPYLAASRELAEEWKKRLQTCPGLKVGLAWGSNNLYRDNQVAADDKFNKSIPVDLLSGLMEIQGVSYVSLQKHESSDILSKLGVVDFSQQLTDFAETAALVENLDLVITIDTAVAHLSGALGKPTWVLLRHVPDWRWFLDREDSPWYPTARLFRQSAAGDWLSVIQRVRPALLCESLGTVANLISIDPKTS